MHVLATRLFVCIPSPTVRCSLSCFVLDDMQVVMHADCKHVGAAMQKHVSDSEDTVIIKEVVRLWVYMYEYLNVTISCLHRFQSAGPSHQHVHRHI